MYKRQIHDSAFIVKGTEESSEKMRKAVSEVGQLYVDDSLNIYSCSKTYLFKFVKDKNYAPVSYNSNPLKDSIFHIVMEIEKGVILSGFNGLSRADSKLFEVDSVYKIRVTSGLKKNIYKYSLGESRTCRAAEFKVVYKRQVVVHVDTSI